MEYITTLKHGDFVLLIDILRKAEESGLICWDAKGMICEHTKVSAED